MLIGEVAQRTGISARMLRHYDRIGLVSPTDRTAGGYRHYSDDDLQLLFRVEGLRSLGLGLAEIPTALTDQRFSARGMIDQLLARARSRLVQAQELVTRLEQVDASSPDAWPDVMRTIGLIRGFDGEDASARQRQALSLPDGDDRDVAVLVDALLREDDLNAQGAIIWAIARVGDAAVPPLAAAFGSSAPELRRRALRGLEKIDSSAARAVVSGMVAHTDPFLRARAHLARGRAGDPRSVDAIVDLIVHTDDGGDSAYSGIDIEAAEVLEVLAESPETAARVANAVAAAAASADPAARRRLAGALASLPGDRAAAALRDLADDHDPTVALTAKALLEVGRPQPDGVQG